MKTIKGKIAGLLIMSVLIVSFMYIKTYLMFPSQITLIQGEEHIYNIKTVFPILMKADKNDILKLNGSEIKASGSSQHFTYPATFTSQTNGTFNLNMKIFGIIPLRNLKVDVVENKKVVPCGNTIGVKLYLKGILVVGVTDVETPDGKTVYPSRDAGIRAGDMILSVNKKEVNSINELIEIIEKNGEKQMKIKISRGNIVRETYITPISSKNNKHHIGLWVRDNTAGIGTLTFYDKQTGKFAALGHGITDMDTGILMPVNSGEIVRSNILDVRKGEQGLPGELKGMFDDSRSKLGTIIVNSEQGVYGVLSEETMQNMLGKEYPIAVRNQIKIGSAKILANVSQTITEEYDIEVMKVNHKNNEGTKGMVIKITDERLLNTTGGIVQGMSGSPIIQDGRIIGAITHVLVNDPTRGYGILIESMIKTLNRMEVLQNAA